MARSSRSTARASWSSSTPGPASHRASSTCAAARRERRAGEDLRPAVPRATGRLPGGGLPAGPGPATMRGYRSRGAGAAVAAVGRSRQGWTMRDRDESRPDGLMDARRRIRPGDGAADDDVSGHGMPEIPGAGDGFSAAPRLPRRDGLAGGTEDDVEGHMFVARLHDEPA